MQRIGRYTIKKETLEGVQLYSHPYPSYDDAMRDWDNVLDGLIPGKERALLLREDGSTASQYQPMKRRSEYGLSM